MTRFIPLLLTGLLPAACATEGLRASTDSCPPGEVCSDVTPDGLVFSGSLFTGEFGYIDRSVKVTAAGGAQTIQVRLNESDEPPPAPFAAEMAGAGWAVAWSDDSEVLVSATSAGVGFLRIADPDSNELYDKVELESRAVERIELRPASREIVFGDHPWVLLAGGSRQVYFDLRAAGDVRLVDENLAIPGGEPISWDAVALDAGEPGPVVVEAITGAGQRFELATELVAEVDEIEVNSAPDAPVPAGTTTLFCFRARSGDATAYGGAWSFRTEGSISISIDPSPIVLSDNCPFVQAGSPGTGTLVAEVGGRSIEVTVEVVEEAAARTAAAPAAPVVSVPPTRGLRAGR